ncbi:N-acetyltransferase family protein [Synechococcus sp. W65.1]|uniref:GNAT family N-acetyltransferase n=1 Tax=Synechococcus sp. W65.1 TaxID=2964526 RepID=UPI0039C257C8
MEIRPARPEDAPALFNLICALAEYEKLSHLVTGSADLLRHHLFGPEAFASALLAEVEGQAVGFALYFRHFSTFLTRPGLYLEDLFVLPEFRGRGIGKALLARVAQEAVAKGYGRLEWMGWFWTGTSRQWSSIGAWAPNSTLSGFSTVSAALTWKRSPRQLRPLSLLLGDQFTGSLSPREAKTSILAAELFASAG